MLKLALMATVTTAVLTSAATRAIADPAGMPAEWVDGLVILSPEVAAQVARLEAYGPRFDKAVAAIRHEAAMHPFRWGTCGTMAAPAPGS